MTRSGLYNRPTFSNTLLNDIGQQQKYLLPGLGNTIYYAAGCVSKIQSPYVRGASLYKWKNCIMAVANKWSLDHSLLKTYRN